MNESNLDSIFRKLLLAFAFAFSFLLSAFSQTDYTQYVNPFIGTGGHGHTFPGATVPFGMVQLSPDTRVDGSWDGCSGYHYSDKKIYGFSHTHLSGTGCSDYGDVMLMPMTGKKYIQKEKYAASFLHENEKAEAGYYSVTLDNKIKAELTTTTRAGFHHYTFPTVKGGYILLDLTHRDKVTESYIKVVSNNRIEGMRVSEAWAQKQYVYFSIEFNRDFSWEMFLDDQSQKNVSLKDNYYSGKNVKAILTFSTKTDRDVYVKVGISQVSVEGARKNMETEIPAWEFENTIAQAKALWNKELSKIDITQSANVKHKPKEASEIAGDKLTIFYTALYHCMIHPSVASDVDGKYRGRDHKIHTAENFTYYTVFSLWDTFRALHPLFTIIDQKRTNDFIKTFLIQAEQGGNLPVWELSSNETDCMIGLPAISVITDAYMKNIRNYDVISAMQYSSRDMKRYSYRGLRSFNTNGFLSIEDENESVSKSLEYGYDAWCLSNLRKNMPEDAFFNPLLENPFTSEFLTLSQSWKNLFDPKTNFIRPRSNGGWLEPFDPREVNNNYTEANAWQYTFFVPHDVNGMIDLMGGNKKFETKLDELFTTSSQTTGRNQADITGLIGQYAHGNEPSHHMAYLYAYARAPHKTQEKVHYIKENFYMNTPDGLIGNEDCGQMSAWYVFSALGFYPVCPGDPKYVLGTPSFEKAIIHLENEKTFTITAEGINDENFYLKEDYSFYITHDKIMNGENLELKMQNTPDIISEFDERSFPENRAFTTYYFPVPVIQSASKTFRDKMELEITSLIPSMEIEYTFQDPFCNNDTCKTVIKKYEEPFTIDHSATIWARVTNYDYQYSNWVSASFHKIVNNYSIEIKSKYNPQYTAGGDKGIIDGLHGDVDWRKGGWQGYQNQDFECIIDLQETKQFQEITATFLQDTRAWIFFPKQVEIYTSYDGKEYSEFGVRPITKFESPTENMEPSIDKASSFTKPIRARYVKIVARNYGKLPKWHQGYGMEGDNAFIFIDEITIF